MRQLSDFVENDPVSNDRGIPRPAVQLQRNEYLEYDRTEKFKLIYSNWPQALQGDAIS